MKECPKCKKKYMDYDQYCFVCRYKLKYIEGTEVIDYPPEPHEPTPTNVPRVECPYCHSTYTRKISKASKMLGNSFFGIFASKRYNQWHCNNCDSDF